MDLALPDYYGDSASVSVGGDDDVISLSPSHPYYTQLLMQQQQQQHQQLYFTADGAR